MNGRTSWRYIDNRADQFIFLEHRHGDKRASAAVLCRGAHDRFRHLVGDADHVFRPPHAFEIGSGIRLKRATLLEKFDKCRRHVEHCGRIKHFVIVAEHHAKFRVANPYRVRQHGLENGIEIARRRADDLEHL